MNETNQLNVAVIGCGRISGHHCRALGETDGARVAAVCDLEVEKAEAYAEEFGAAPFADYRAMLEAHPEINTVVIATPSGMHFEHALELINDYGKNVIVEKPTVMRPGHLIDLCAAADEKGVNVFPVFQNRYNKAVRRVKRAIESGELGEVRIISVRVRWCRPQRYYDLAPWRGTFSHDGGAITNQGIHHVDLIRHLGGDVARVNATMRTLGADIEVEDTVVGTFEMASGAVGNLEVTTAARPDDFEASISLVCANGLAQIGGIGVNELQVFTPDPDACAAESEDFTGIDGHGAVYGWGHWQMYGDIVTFFRDDVPYPVSRDDAHGTLKLLHAFYRADEAGDWVEVAAPDESVRLGRDNEPVSDLYRTPRKGAA